MKPQRIAGFTREQDHPAHGTVHALSLPHRVDDKTVTRKWVTEWKPTSEELNRLKRGAGIMLAVAGPTLPFVDVWVGEPTK